MAPIAGIAGLLALALSSGPAVRLIRGALDDSDAAAPPGERLGAGDRALLGAAVCLLWAFGVVPSLTFYLHLATTLLVSWPTLVATAVLATALLVRLRFRRGPAPPPFATLADAFRPELLGGLRQRLPELAAALLIGLYFYATHNTTLATGSCLYTTTMMVTGVTEAPHLLTHSFADARLGNTGVLSTFATLFGDHFVGARVLKGVCGVFLALGGYLIGRLVGGGRAFGVLGLLFLPLNPYVVGIPLIDENIIALAFGALTLPLFLLRSPPWFWTGVFFGLVVTMRHVLVLAVPAAALSALIRRDWRRALRGGVLGFLVATAFENLHHLLALGSVFRFESNNQFEAYFYELGPLSFHWQGFLNWPLHHQIVRTPANPFPMFVTWPLWLTGQLGVAVVSVVLTGFLALWRRDWRGAAFWTLWSAPVYLALSVQECWDYANKAGVIIIVFGAAVAFFVSGALALRRRPLVWVPVAVAFGVLAASLPGRLEDWRMPADERYYAYYPTEDREIDSFVDWQRARTLDLGLLPDYGRALDYGRFQLHQLPGEREPWETGAPWGWWGVDDAPEGEHVAWRLDFTEAPWGRTDFIESVPIDTEHDVYLSDADDLVVVPDIRVSWDSEPLTLYLGNIDGITSVLGFVRNYDQLATWDRDGVLFGQLPCNFYSCVSSRGGCDAHRRIIRLPEGVVRPVFRTRSGGLQLAFNVKLIGDRGQIWKGTIEERAARLLPPVAHWHN